MKYTAHYKIDYTDAELRDTSEIFRIDFETEDDFSAIKMAKRYIPDIKENRKFMDITNISLEKICETRWLDLNIRKYEPVTLDK